MKLTLDYIAGLVDGEGSISIAKMSRKYGSTFRLYVSVASQNKIVLELLRESLGVGTISLGLTTWVLTVANKQAEYVLALIVDRLVTKKKQAEIALRFRALVQPTGKRRIEEVENAKAICRLDMMEANAKDSREFAKIISVKSGKAQVVNPEPAGDSSLRACVETRDGSRKA